MHFDTKGISEYAKSHRMVTLMTALGFLIIALVIFEAGVAVGFHKASFAYHWEENYEHNFGGARRMGVLPGSIPNPNGAFGTIESVTLPTFVVEGDDEPEKVVRITGDTLIRTQAGNGTSTDLQEGQSVIIVGGPSDDGVIEARLIRIQPGE